MIPGDFEALGPIQLIPTGLMGLLQLKQTGKMPGWLAQSVQPTIDLSDWYLQARREDEQSLFGGTPTTVPLVTGNTQLRQFNAAAIPVVPQNQLWWVEHYSVFGSTNAAADVMSFGPAIANAGGSSFQLVGLPYIDLAAGTRTRSFCTYASRGFWAGPGDQFWIMVFDIASAGITMQCRLRVTRLPI